MTPHTGRPRGCRPALNAIGDTRGAGQLATCLARPTAMGLDRVDGVLSAFAPGAMPTMMAGSVYLRPLRERRGPSRFGACGERASLPPARVGACAIASG